MSGSPTLNLDELVLVGRGHEFDGDRARVRRLQPLEHLDDRVLLARAVDDARRRPFALRIREVGQDRRQRLGAVLGRELVAVGEREAVAARVQRRDGWPLREVQGIEPRRTMAMPTIGVDEADEGRCAVSDARSNQRTCRAIRELMRLEVRRNVLDVLDVPVDGLMLASPRANLVRAFGRGDRSSARQHRRRHRPRR